MSTGLQQGLKVKKALFAIRSGVGRPRYKANIPTNSKSHLPFFDIAGNLGNPMCPPLCVVFQSFPVSLQEHTHPAHANGAVRWMDKPRSFEVARDLGVVRGELAQNKTC